MGKDLLDDLLEEEDLDKMLKESEDEGTAGKDDDKDKAGKTSKKSENDEDKDQKTDPINSKLTSALDKIDALSRQNKGLIKDLQGERKTRQEMAEFKGKYEQLNETVNQILTAQQSKDGGVAKKIDGVPMEYDEETEKYYMPNNVIDAIVNKIDEKIGLISEQVSSVAQTQTADSQAKQIIDSIISENEKFGDAYGKLNKAYNWVNQKVVDYMNQTGVDNITTSSQILDLIDGSEIEKEFSSEFEGLNLNQVVRSHDTKSELRSALSSISSSGEKVEKKVEEKKESKTSSDDDAHSETFKKVLKKPSTLEGGANQQGKNIDAFERLAALSTEEIIDNFSDADVAKLERALKREEENELNK